MWSYSRLGTYKGCHRKYRLNYVEKWKPTIKVGTELADKGLAVHETFEAWDDTWDLDKAYDYLHSKAEEHGVDLSKFPIDQSVPRYDILYNKVYKNWKSKGLTQHNEYKIEGTLGNEEFVGYIDVLFENKDKIIILDYKTAKGMNGNLYWPQLMLYCILEGQKRGWSLEQISERCDCFVFFPLANVKPGENVLLHKKPSVEELKEVYDSNVGTVKEIHDTDWTVENTPNYSNACSWCPFCGSKPSEDGQFMGCAFSGFGCIQPDEQTYVRG